ncbi:protein NYNRIN-like isoform X2, partial [Arapaima gigas]
HVFSVVHDFGALWKWKSLLTSSGPPTKYYVLIENLLSAILFSSSLAIVKTEAHTNLSCDVTRGNATSRFSCKLRPLPWRL